MVISLVKLTENDKRLIIVLLLIFILLFVISGYIGLLVKKIMSHQAEKADDMLHDVVVANVITSEKALWKFGIRKNFRYFFRKAFIPVCIMLGSFLVLFIYSLIMKKWPDIWDYKTEGIGTLFHIFDWAHVPTTTFFGLTIINAWPECISTPHLSMEAWGAYIFIPGMLVGGLWYLYEVQAYIARAFRIRKLSKKVFNKSLENFDNSSNPRSPINPE